MLFFTGSLSKVDSTSKLFLTYEALSSLALEYLRDLPVLFSPSRTLRSPNPSLLTEPIAIEPHSFEIIFLPLPEKQAPCLFLSLNLKLSSLLLPMVKNGVLKSSTHCTASGGKSSLPLCDWADSRSWGSQLHTILVVVLDQYAPSLSYAAIGQGSAISLMSGYCLVLFLKLCTNMSLFSVSNGCDHKANAPP